MLVVITYNALHILRPCYTDCTLITLLKFLRADHITFQIPDLNSDMDPYIYDYYAYEVNSSRKSIAQEVHQNPYDHSLYLYRLFYSFSVCKAWDLCLSHTSFLRFSTSNLVFQEKKNSMSYFQ